MLRCLLPWFHTFGWPRKSGKSVRETCIYCGKTRKARIKFWNNPRFQVQKRKGGVVELPMRRVAK